MSNIKKIKTFRLKKINNPKGNILRAFRKTDKNSGGFAEIYFSWINKNNIKGWKLHKQMSMNIVVPVGMVKFVFFDGKNFKKIILGEKKYLRMFVPSNIFFAFQNLSSKKSLIVNNASIIHKQKGEIVTINLKKINYKWKN